jgi:hypothetical protein
LLGVIGFRAVDGCIPDNEVLNLVLLEEPKAVLSETLHPKKFGGRRVERDFSLDASDSDRQQKGEAQADHPLDWSFHLGILLAVKAVSSDHESERVVPRESHDSAARVGDSAGLPSPSPP